MRTFAFFMLASAVAVIAAYVDANAAEPGISASPTPTVLYQTVPEHRESAA